MKLILKNNSFRPIYVLYTELFRYSITLKLCSLLFSLVALYEISVKDVSLGILNLFFCIFFFPKIFGLFKSLKAIWYNNKRNRNNNSGVNYKVTNKKTS